MDPLQGHLLRSILIIVGCILQKEENTYKLGKSWRLSCSEQRPPSYRRADDVMHLTLNSLEMPALRRCKALGASSLFCASGNPQIRICAWAASKLSPAAHHQGVSTRWRCTGTCI
ncbi:hypothetical protein MGG_16891 [Pyricularia oryzae 70-15]|uniref:Uncharacterized protein n=1 Tax=Pyricularia oryzae (strain 70-15 / ATCC MYA-4617 / FGSC 8958) TaxID=242507 RepID=G4N5B5_PYRO7|nr:uncharacterized protein MGG_16891 [Pyricularia oryzae 70-15]EHA52972.1 hypothetical protein MGG_16891 [Pyricularia oryzae 70-15]